MWRVDSRRSALLVIDMQNDFVLPGHPMHVPMALDRLPTMRRVVAACRAVGMPVIYTEHILLDTFDISPLETAYNPVLRTAGLRAGSDGARIVDELAPESGDVVVRKHRYDAFHNTCLETVLATVSGPRVIDTVVIVGTLTEICCDSTARGAYMRDFRVVFVGDATGGLSDASQRATESVIGRFFGRVLASDELIAEFR
ncbi:MAG TPA: isochorismatase family cysteine hydrolase [Pseudonocardiaceae bacterium]|jgi:ureidoacrylate peracid hydrolase